MRKIVLPRKNTKLVTQLRLKLEEYKTRLEEAKKNLANKKSTDQSNKMLNELMAIDSAYKIIVLGQLLWKGEVIFDDIEQKLRQRTKDRFSHLHLDDVFDVIESYCKDGGRGVRGGTGLPEINS